MNKTMMQMMKPIPQTSNNKAELRRRQEEHILAWLKGYPNSVNRHDVVKNCPDIPGISTSDAPTYTRYNRGRACASVLQRLEKKGHVVSVLCGDGYRYYSVPVNGGVQ